MWIYLNFISEIHFKIITIDREKSNLEPDLWYNLISDPTDSGKLEHHAVDVYNNILYEYNMAYFGFGSALKIPASYTTTFDGDYLIS